VVMLANIIACLYFTRPSSYILGAQTLSLAGLSFSLGACWNHRLSKLHPAFLASPFHIIPLAFLLIICILYCVVLSLLQYSQFQSVPMLLTCILGFFAGLFLYKKNALNIQPLRQLNTAQWEKMLSTHFDHLVLYQIFSQRIVEHQIQGIMTDSMTEQAHKYLPRYFQLLELQQSQEEFLKELVKLQVYFDISVLCSKSSPLWLHHLTQSQLLNEENDIRLKIEDYLKKNAFSAPLQTLQPSIKASRLRRLLAFFIDLALYSLCLSLVQNYIDPLFLKIPSIRNVDFIYYAEIFSKIVTICVLIIPPLLFWQATLGKKMLSIKIVHSNNAAAVSHWQILGRELLGKPLSSFLLLMGYMMILLPGKKTLHDHLFATKVIIDYND